MPHAAAGVAHVAGERHERLLLVGRALEERGHDPSRDHEHAPRRHGKRIVDREAEAVRADPLRLGDFQPPWDQELPIWELRVGGYRVFYDVQERARLVTVRAIRLKPPHKTTEEIL
jgi:hypothetical protein